MRAISKVLSLGATAAFVLTATLSAPIRVSAAPSTTAMTAPTHTHARAQSSLTSPPTQGSSGIPTPPPVPGVHVVMPVGTSTPTLPPPNNLPYGQGPTLHGFTRVALIFWGPNWAGSDNARASTVNGMFQHIGVNAWTDTLLQYYDNTSSVDDTSSMYVGQWTDTATAPPATYTTVDILNEVQRAISLGLFAYDANTVYLVFPNGGAKNDQPGACGYHTAGASQWGYIIAGAIDEGMTPGCNIGPIAGVDGDAVTEGMTKVALHELAEAVTDPLFNGWGYTPPTSEIGDLCNNNIITVNFGGNVYAAQQIFGNREGACLSGTNVTYSYRWISQTYTPNPSPARGSYNVQVVVQNTGNVQWPVRSVLRLGTDQPQNRCSAYYDSGTWLNCWRVGGLQNQGNTAYSTVQPGQNAVFSFNFFMNPGRTCSTSNEYFNLVFEARQWLNSAGIYWPVTIGCYNGAFQSEAVPSPGLVAGDNPATNLTRIRFTNTGNLPWYNDGYTTLTTSGCSMFYDSMTWNSCNVATGRVINVTNSSKTQVDPGEVGEFDVVLNVPVTTLPGNYSQQWVLIEQGAQVMGSSYHTSTYTVLT